MISKVFVELGGEHYARITFTMPECTWSDTIHLVGDFNSWNHTSHPFVQDAQGNWSITIDLPVGRAYQFRYLCDGCKWVNDSHADAYVRNFFGDDNFVIVTDPGFKPYNGA